jgi:DNA-directed RNA polymerase subunit E'/Rpb7
MRLKVEKKIFIEPSLLNDNIKQHILEKIKKMEGTCNIDDGFIVKTYDDFKILSNEVSSINSGVFVNVSFYIDNFKPVLNTVYKGVILKEEPEFIIVQVQGMLDVIVNDWKKIPKDIQVEIVSIQYINSKFLCIGKFIDPKGRFTDPKGKDLKGKLKK